MSYVVLSASRRNLFCIEFFFPLYLCLSQYSQGFSIGGIAILLLAVKKIMYLGKNFSFSKDSLVFFMFFGFVLFRDLVRIPFDLDSTQTQINKIIVYVISFLSVLIATSGKFDMEKLYKYLKIVGFVFGGGLVYHCIQIYMFGSFVFPITVIPGYSFRDVSAIAGYRPMSFFSEPALFAVAMVPLLYMSLQKKDLWTAFVVSVLILLSTSTTGVLILIILWGESVLNKSISIKSRWGIIVIFSVLVVSFFSLDFFSNSLEKASGVMNGGGTFSSRVLCGIDVNRSQNFTSLLFGTNYNDVREYVTNERISSELTGAVINRYNIFINTVSLVIFKYGFLGLVFYFMSFLYFFLKYRNMRSYIIVCICSSFGESMFLNSIYFMHVIFILILCHSTLKKDKEGVLYG